MPSLVVSFFSHFHRLWSRKRSRRGNVVVLTAVLSPVLIGMVAFAMDLGYLSLVRTQLQAAADSSALAAVAASTEGADAARAAATRFSEANFAAGAKARLAPNNGVELGTWNETTRSFAVLTEGAAEANAARVTCGCTESSGNSVQLFFGRIYGMQKVDSTATAVAIRQTSPCSRIVGLDWVLNENGETDSYNSNEGPYNVSTRKQGGNVCSNGSIENKLDGAIRGNATPGKGHMVFGAGLVTGTTSPSSVSIVPKPVDPSDAIAVNDNAKISKYLNSRGDFTLDGGRKVSIPPGTYYVRGDLLISGRATLEVTGPTTIYIDGIVDLAGNGITNAGQKPSNLTLFSRGPTASFRGSSDFYGTFYGPGTNVDIAGTPNFFGAVIGKTLKIRGDAEVHYDEALDKQKFRPQRMTLVQ